MLFTIAPSSSVITAELLKSNVMSYRTPLGTFDQSATTTSAAVESQNTGSVAVSWKGCPAPPAARLAAPRRTRACPAAAQPTNLEQHVRIGWGWFWVILAAIFDLAHLGASIARRRELMARA